MRYKRRAIVSGDIIEVFEYDNFIVRGEPSNPRGRKTDNMLSVEEKLDNRKKVQQRARSDLRRLVSANVGRYTDEKGQSYKPLFATLTFAENVTDTKVANKEFREFMKRLNYHTGHGKKQGLKYVVVVEFQARGAVHYHAIFFNLGYIPNKKLAEIWGQGFVRINAIDEVDNVGAYVCKYMGKDLAEDKLIGQKCYFSSRGLHKPVEVVNEKEIDQLGVGLPQNKMVFENSFSSDYLGVIHYKQYNLKKRN